MNSWRRLCVFGRQIGTFGLRFSAFSTVIQRPLFNKYRAGRGSMEPA